ncbi:MAG: hypothetical protein JWQ59_2467 [Cryobacterium sp.]|nr:hypothetical protein [Cryobacterium sp.]
MKRMLLLLAAVALAACSDPHSVVISMASPDKEKMQEVMKELPDDDRALITGYMMRTMVAVAFSGKSDFPSGVTIGQGIKAQKEWLAEQKVKEAEAAALKAKLLAERQGAEKQMRDIVTVTLVKKELQATHGYSGITMDENLTLTVGYKNNGTRPIAGVKGRLVIYDIFGKEVTVFGISSDSDIGPSSVSTWVGGRSIRYGMKSSEDKQFANMDEGKYKVVWEPQMIVFKDGTKIAAAE